MNYVMYSNELVKRISAETHLSERIIREVLTETQTVIRDTLKSGQDVRLPGFGLFYVRQKKATKVRSVRTGKTVDVPARRVPAFRPGVHLKRALYKPKRGLFK